MGKEAEQKIDSSKSDDSIVVGGEGSSKAGHRSSLPKTIKLALPLIAIAVVGIFLLQQHSKNSGDKTLGKEVRQYASSTTDCSGYLNKYGKTKAHTYKLQASLLATDIDCAINTKHYDLASSYTDELDKLYTAHKELYHYVNIENTRQSIKDAQAQDQADRAAAADTTPKQPSGLQADGSYYGP